MANDKSIGYRMQTQCNILVSCYLVRYRFPDDLARGHSLTELFAALSHLLVRYYKEVHVCYLTDSASGGASRETECPICLNTWTNPRTLKCKHIFCTECVETALKHNNRCPVCKEVQGVIQGNQPKGEMGIQKSYDRLPGYYGNLISNK